MQNYEHPTGIDRDYIRLLQAMRRFIHDEFACTIHMSQDDSVEQLLHYAERSRNHMLRDMGKTLREFVYRGSNGKEVSDEIRQKVRYYRGAAILIEEETPATPATPPQTSSKLVYRGQIIGG